MFQAEFVEKIKTQFMFKNFLFFVENRAVYETMWKNVIRPGEATDDNTAHAHSMLHN